MGRPVQQLKVFGVQDRRTTTRAKLPWIVRWAIDGKQRTKAYRTRAEAERYRSLLLAAVHNGDRFHETTGEPASWQPALPDTNGAPGSAGGLANSGRSGSLGRASRRSRA